MSVALLVSNRGTEVKALQPLNTLDIFVTLLVFNFGEVVNPD